MPYKETWGEKAKERSKLRNAYFQEYRNRFPEKKKARAIANYLLKKGVIKKEDCKFKSTTCHGRSEAHHNDYSKPTEVTWLCSYHHRVEHKKIGNQKNYNSPIYKDAKSNCLKCGIKISLPCRYYCSSKCNLSYWRENGKIKTGIR